MLPRASFKRIGGVTLTHRDRPVPLRRGGSFFAAGKHDPFKSTSSTLRKAHMMGRIPSDRRRTHRDPERP